jgi:hypothetical protein
LSARRASRSDCQRAGRDSRQCDAGGEARANQATISVRLVHGSLQSCDAVNLTGGSKVCCLIVGIATWFVVARTNNGSFVSFGVRESTACTMPDGGTLSDTRDTRSKRTAHGSGGNGRASRRCRTGRHSHQDCRSTVLRQRARHHSVGTLHHGGGVGIGTPRATRLTETGWLARSRVGARGGRPKGTGSQIRS